MHELETSRLFNYIMFVKIVYFVVSFVFSLSFGVLTLFCFTSYRLALVLVSKSGGADDHSFILLRFNYSFS